MNLAILRTLSTTLDASRQKYPSQDPITRIMGWVQEGGEASQALAKWVLHPTDATKAHALEECYHAMGQIHRVIEMLEAE